jgi:hypothetical protein
MLENAVTAAPNSAVMARLDPWAFSPRACPVGIHDFGPGASVDDRVKPGHDGDWG